MRPYRRRTVTATTNTTHQFMLGHGRSDRELESAVDGMKGTIGAVYETASCVGDEPGEF